MVAETGRDVTGARPLRWGVRAAWGMARGRAILSPRRGLSQLVLAERCLRHDEDARVCHGVGVSLVRELGGTSRGHVPYGGGCARVRWGTRVGGWWRKVGGTARALGAPDVPYGGVRARAGARVNGGAAGAEGRHAGWGRTKPLKSRPEWPMGKYCRVCDRLAISLPDGSIIGLVSPLSSIAQLVN